MNAMAMSRASRLDQSVATLLQINERCDTPTVRRALTVCVFVGATAALTLNAMRSEKLDAPPPIGGDAVIYDSLGWELASGRGFSLNFRDGEFIEPYARVDPEGASRLVEVDPQGPIASRPPLMPLVMAVINRVWGRQFRGIRLVNIGAMGIVAALVFSTVCRLAGPLPAMLGVAQFLIVDPRVREASRELLTESLASLLIAVLAVVLVRLANRPRISTAVLAGAIVGLSMLVRTMFVLWIPAIAALLWLLSRSAASPDGQHDGELRNASGTQRLGLVAAFVLVACVVFSPWGWRNHRVLGRMMPLGTQGTMELSAGYSDAAFVRWGMWHNLEETGFFTEVDVADQTAVQRELARADYSRAEAVAWCCVHPLKTALLPLMKVFQEFRPHMSGDLYVLAFALLGMTWVRGTPEGRVWVWIVVSTAFGVAVTWSVAGRFVFPVLYVLHCAAAIGAWNALLACTLRRVSSSDGDSGSA